MQLVLFLLTLFIGTVLYADGYKVNLEGVNHSALKKAFTSRSQTISLKDKAAPSSAILKRRAENDKEKLEEIAHFYGYYSAQVTYSIDYSDPRLVTFRCDLGPQYILESCSINVNIEPQEIKLKPGAPIDTQMLIDAEKAIIWHMKKQGYATCSIAKRSCTANTQTHTLCVTFDVSPGPLVHFGPLHIVGNTQVLQAAIQKYIAWKEGDIYDPIDIEKTQACLEKTGLFSSVIITEEQENMYKSLLPLAINVQESTHHSVGAGVAYATSFGPGVKAEWENINLRGLGEKLKAKTEIWQKYQMALLSHTVPHFYGQDQDLLSMTEYDKLRTVAFDSRSYNLSVLLQKRIGARTETVQGLRAEWLHSHNFEGSRFYHLLKVPLQFKWSNANNLLDPTQGENLNIKLTPTTNYFPPRFFYTIHTTTLSGYHSFSNNHVTLAARVVFGNILGAARHTIPPPDRFYGGSENVLRGYRAYTISPLHHKRIPIGGRSMLAGSLEARFRTSGDLGWALFYDVGNVYRKNVPEITVHQFHSVGAGIRYSTPIGPLRFDVAVPLKRRHHIDPLFQIYFSIGQSF